MANLKLIKKLCVDKNITIVDLSMKVGITPVGLHRIINTNSTKVDTLEKIANILEVPITVFFQEDNNLSDFLDSPVLKFVSNRLDSFYAKIGFYKDYYVWRILNDLKSGSLQSFPFNPYKHPDKPKELFTDEQKKIILNLPEEYFNKSYIKWNLTDRIKLRSNSLIIDSFYFAIFDKNFMNIRDLLEDGIIKDKEFLTYWKKYNVWKKI